MNDADRLEVEHITFDILEKTGLLSMLPEITRENIIKSEAQVVPSNVVAPQTGLDFETISHGLTVGYPFHSCLAIRTQADLDWFWPKFVFGALTPPAAPTVNFASDMLIAACRGAMSTYGYITTISHVIDVLNPISGATDRWVTIAQCDPWGITKSEYSYPHHIVKVALSSNIVHPIYYWVLQDET